MRPRPRKRLYDRRDAMLEKLREQYLKRGTVGKIEHRTDLKKKARPRTGRTAGTSARKGRHDEIEIEIETRSTWRAMRTNYIRRPLVLIRISNFESRIASAEP